MARILPTGLAQPWEYKEKKIVQHTPMTQVGPTELKAIYNVGKTLWDEVISPNMAALIGAIVRANQAEGPDRESKVKEVNRIIAAGKVPPAEVEKAKEAAAAIAPTPAETPAPAEAPAEEEVLEFGEEDFSEFTSEELIYWNGHILPKLQDGSLDRKTITAILETKYGEIVEADMRPEAFSLAVKTYFESLLPRLTPDALVSAGLVSGDRHDIELQAAQIEYPELNFSRDPETGKIKTERPLQVGLGVAADLPGPGFESVTGQRMSLTGELPAGSPLVGPGIERSFAPSLGVTKRYEDDDFTGGFPAPPAPEPSPPTAVPSSPAAVAREPEKYGNIWARAAAAIEPEEQEDIIQEYVDMYQPRDMGEVLWGEDYRKEAQARRIKDFMVAASKYKGDSPALEEKRRLQNIEQAMKNKALERSYGDLTDPEKAALTGAELEFYNKAIKARRQQVITDQKRFDLEIDKKYADRRGSAETIMVEDKVHITRAKEQRAIERWEIDKAQAELDATLTKQKVRKLVRELKEKVDKSLKYRVDYIKEGLRQRAIRITYEIREMLGTPRVYGTRIAAKVTEHDRVVKEIQSLGRITTDAQLRSWISAH